MRESAGLQGYEGGFVEHYILPVLYPSGLTRGVQLSLGLVVIALNVAIYWIFAVRKNTPTQPAAPQL